MKAPSGTDAYEFKVIKNKLDRYNNFLDFIFLPILFNYLIVIEIQLKKLFIQYKNINNLYLKIKIIFTFYIENECVKINFFLAPSYEI